VTQGKRVLVSGAGGFIGRWSVPALLRLGYEVHAVLSGKASRDVPEQLRGAKPHFANLLDDFNTRPSIREMIIRNDEIGPLVLLYELNKCLIVRFGDHYPEAPVPQQATHSLQHQRNVVYHNNRFATDHVARSWR